MSLYTARCHTKTDILAYISSQTALAQVSLILWRPERQTVVIPVEAEGSERIINLKLYQLWEKSLELTSEPQTHVWL